MCGEGIEEWKECVLVGEEKHFSGHGRLGGRRMEGNWDWDWDWVRMRGKVVEANGD